MKLDLACGDRKEEGFLGIDRIQIPGVDVIHDLEVFPWPFDDNSCEELRCCHYIEHTKDLIAFMDECWRILVPEGRLTVIAPYYTSVRAWQDPTHLRAISEVTFFYFNKNWRAASKLDHYGIRADFNFTYAYGFMPDWANRNDEARNFAISHYWNIVADIQVILTKIPGEPAQSPKELPKKRQKNTTKATTKGNDHGY